MCRCFKHPLTPDNSSRVLARSRPPDNRRCERSSNSSNVDLYCFSVPDSRFSTFILPRFGGASPFVCHHSTAHRSCSYICPPRPPFSHLSTHHLARQYSAQDNPASRPNNPAFTMVVRDYTTVNLRLPQTSHPNLAQLNDRVERRRPKPKIQPRPPEYYQNLIDQHDKTTVKRNYADTTKDNLQDIIDKFSR